MKRMSLKNVNKQCMVIKPSQQFETQSQNLEFIDFVYKHEFPCQSAQPFSCHLAQLLCKITGPKANFAKRNTFKAKLEAKVK